MSPLTFEDAYTGGFFVFFNSVKRKAGFNTKITMPMDDCMRKSIS